MKRRILIITTIAVALTGFTNCKEKENQTTATEAQEVAEAPVVAVSYEVDVEASNISWKGFKPLESHNGDIQLASGSVAMENGSLTAGKFTIDMNSINNLDMEGGSKQSLEAHLKGTAEGKEDHFFNVAEYPFASFEMTGIAEVKGKMFLEGNLTIKDQTHNIQFPVSINTSETQVMLNSEPFTIDRTQWGVNYGSKSIFEDLGDKFINDDIELTIALVANKA